MKSVYLLLCLIFAPAVNDVSAQTLFHEGKGSMVGTTPAVLGRYGVGYALNGSYTHRISNRFDVSASAGYSDLVLTTGASLGYTNRFSDAGWGFRSSLGFTAFSTSGGYQSGELGWGATLFRQVDLSERVQAFPNVHLNSGVLLGSFRPDAGVSASIDAPIYFQTWRQVRLFVTPSYRVGLLPRVQEERRMSIGFGALLSLPRR